MDSLNDDLLEMVMAHLDHGALLDLADTSVLNKEAVCNYVQRWRPDAYFKMFSWILTTRGKILDRMVGYGLRENTFSSLTACIFAAAEGNLEMLKILRRYDRSLYKWNGRIGAAHVIGVLETCRAAHGGHVWTLRWLIDEGCYFSNKALIRLGTMAGSIEVIKFVTDELIKRPSPEVAAIAIKRGHFHVLVWLWSQPFMQLPEPPAPTPPTPPPPKVKPDALSDDDDDDDDDEEEEEEDQYDDDRYERNTVIAFACEIAIAEAKDHSRIEGYLWLLENGRCAEALAEEWDRATRQRELSTDDPTEIARRKERDYKLMRKERECEVRAGTAFDPPSALYFPLITT